MKMQPHEKRILRVLNDKQWHHSAEIELMAQVDGVHIREFANESNLIISSVKDGYRLAKHATMEERKHAYRSLRSRAREISRRAAALKEVWIS